MRRYRRWFVYPFQKMNHTIYSKNISRIELEYIIIKK